MYGIDKKHEKAHWIYLIRGASPSRKAIYYSHHDVMGTNKLSCTPQRVFFFPDTPGLYAYIPDTPSYFYKYDANRWVWKQNLYSKIVLMHLWLKMANNLVVHPGMGFWKISDWRNYVSLSTSPSLTHTNKHTHNHTQTYRQQISGCVQK